MGISWSIEQPDIGVRIRDTFIGLPSQKGGLVGGDVILRVGDAPVNTPQDVVFHWDQAEKEQRSRSTANARKRTDLYFQRSLCNRCRLIGRRRSHTRRCYPSSARATPHRSG